MYVKGSEPEWSNNNITTNGDVNYPSFYLFKFVKKALTPVIN